MFLSKWHKYYIKTKECQYPYRIGPDSIPCKVDLACQMIPFFENKMFLSSIIKHDPCVITQHPISIEAIHCPARHHLICISYFWIRLYFVLNITEILHIFYVKQQSIKTSVLYTDILFTLLLKGKYKCSCFMKRLYFLFQLNWLEPRISSIPVQCFI